MAIEQAPVLPRADVLWLGQPIDGSIRDFCERMNFFIAEPSDVLRLGDDDYLSTLAAVVISQSDAKLSLPATLLAEHGERLLNHDCRIIVIATLTGVSLVRDAIRKAGLPAVIPKPPAADEAFEVFDGKRVLAFKDGVPPQPYVAVYLAPLAVDALVRFILSSNLSPGAAPSSGGFGIAGSPINRAHRVLLRRAFRDCSEVHLRELSGGKSAEKVYLAHAKLSQPLLGRRPRPFFVKMGGRDAVFREWKNYEERVQPYIPFHLAPRLITRRCGLGAKHGIIVGDFVEDSESLRECAESERAATPIGTLFDRTLRGWHYQAYTKRESLGSTLAGLLRGDVPDSRVKLANELGASLSPNALRGRLRARGPEPLLWGPTHGDLHADNIRVRGTDSIVIDFNSARNGPLVSDAAALEASVLVRMPCESDFDPSAWLRIIQSLFTPDSLTSSRVWCEPSEAYAWIADCIRQIRLHGFAMERLRGQYAAALAYRLFQLAVKDRQVGGAEGYRRSVAYAMSDRIVALDLQ